MTWSFDLSSLAAFITAVGGIFIAIYTRRAARDDSHRIDNLYLYIDYLQRWIKENTKTRKKPLSLDEFFMTVTARKGINE